MTTGGFTSPVDIANRGLQHVGAKRIVTLADNTTAAAEVNACYDGLRLAELRRNIWRFATRNVILRPVTPTTMLLVAPPWSAATTYSAGAVVSYGGLIWSSATPSNINNTPGQGNGPWDIFFGSLTADIWATPTGGGYWAGEIVYKITGQGSATVYLSLMNGNTDDPAVPPAWVSTEIYPVQTIIGFGITSYQSQIDLNIGLSPAIGILVWSSSTTYATGAYVYGSNNTIYQAISGTTNVNPTTDGGVHWRSTGISQYTLAQTCPPWLFFENYGNAATVTGSDGNVYTSTKANNLGINPVGDTTGSWTASGLPVVLLAAAAPVWASGTTYAANQPVSGSDGFLYTSVAGSNIGHNPVTDGGVHWTATGYQNAWLQTNQGGSINWLNLGANLTDLIFIYPIGTGPTSQGETRNVFRLPNGYLRPAPADPKEGSDPWLGAPAGPAYDDFRFQGNFIISELTTPIMFRFIANVTSVPDMDDLFCEGLGCRIGVEVCERLTQSVEKIKTIEQQYKVFMTDARTVDAIEIGPIEQPVDEYLTARY